MHELASNDSTAHYW